MANKPTEPMPQVPLLSNIGELDANAVIKIYEEKLKVATTANVMMEAQLEMAMNDRQKLLAYVEELGGNKPVLVPESVAN